jgi:pre-mRNA-splicing helicase BRR2
MDVDAGEEGGEGGGLRVQEIDAYWLQRRVAAAFPGLDASGAQKLAADVFGALQVPWEPRRGCAGASWRGSCSLAPLSSAAHLVLRPLNPMLAPPPSPPTHPQEDPAAVENRVVALLGLDQFPLAKELLRNRPKIVWVTKLRQAQV